MTIPVDFESVCDAAVTDPIVRSLVAWPLAFQLLNVLVVAAVNKIEHALVAVRDAVMSEKVFDPVMVSAPAPPWSNVQL